MKRIVRMIGDSFLGPVVVVSLMTALGLLYIIPSLNEASIKAQSIEQAERLVEHIRIFRSYYNDHILSKVRQSGELKVNYDHFERNDTVPLPATTVHDLGAAFNRGSNVGVQMYSRYPFPNRNDRVLDGFASRALDHFAQRSDAPYVEYDGHKQAYRVAFPDFLSAPSCVECHNTRADSPKRDWRLGDIRGVIEVIEPIDTAVGAGRTMMIYVIVFVGANLLILIVHFSLLSYRRSKNLHVQNLKLEDEVHQRTLELENRNKILSEYKQAVDAGGIVSKTDRHGVITYVNQAFVQISGYTRDELIGRSHNIVRHQDTPSTLFKELWRTILARRIWKGEIKNRRKDGSSYFVHATICPIVNEHDEITEFLAIRYETTAFHEAIEKAQRAEQAKGRFLANMSHELRTPLNAIIGFSQILQRKPSLAPAEKSYVDKILISGQNLLQLVNTILDFSKIEEGKMDCRLERFALERLISEVRVLFEAQIRAKRLHVTWPNQTDAWVYADVQLLKQALVNLIGNAVKFTPEEGSIQITYDADTDRCRLCVCDSGKGIAPEDLSKLFQPFEQGSNAEGVKGTGLGLALSKKIVEELHGGSLLVESKPERGCCFTITLPLVQE
ncbi:MAG: DUF3365 domain-containing protein [Campylobacterales bacterium]|nr:DUF3365 domain-containing protein [Campylobacterales bacterium]